MPVFDFICQDCKTIFEFSRPFGSNEVPNCPNCKSKNVKKQIAPPSIHFKGEGFYKTDSLPKTKKEIDESKSKEKETNKEEKTEKKPERTQTENKPAEKIKEKTKEQKKYNTDS